MNFRAVGKLILPGDVQQRLGDDGLAELTACLWAVDCQSCGRLLGAEPPAVCVDDLGGVAIASLHHPRCRLPGWNESMVVVAGSGQYTTFVARMVLLPVALAGGVNLILRPESYINFCNASMLSASVATAGISLTATTPLPPRHN